MTSRYLINAILILLIGGLYWFNNNDRTNNHLSPLTTIARDDIDHITITKPHHTDIKLQKTAAGWQISEPFSAPANKTRVDLLLSLLSTHSYSQLAQQEELAKFGLAEGKIKLTLGSELFQFGDIESVSNRRYLLYHNVIHLIDDNIAPMLKANAASFIENKLLTNKKNIHKIALPLRNADNRFSDHTMTIENNNGNWQSNQEKMTTAGLKTLIDTWQQSYALYVSPIKPDSKQKSHASYAITIWLEDNSVIDLAAHLSGNTLYITNAQQGLSYQFSKDMVRQLFAIAP